MQAFFKEKNLAGNGIMIQIQTELTVADNTGAKRVECIKVLGGSKRRYASVGDIIVISVKDAIPKGKVKKGAVHKAVVVEVTRKFKHPFYEKVIKRSKKYHAHDEKNKFKEGEKVSIVESKPFSKKKTWQVME